MGRRGPLPKAAGRAVGHHPRAEIVHLVPKPATRIPRAPDGLLPSIRRDWRAFWASPIAQFVTPENRPALERLFLLRDDFERESAIFREGRLVRGSVGQWRMNPLAGHLLQLEAAILRLEVEFGLTPLAASRLGLVFGEATRSLGDLNRRLHEQGSDSEEAHDPYAALLEPDHHGRGKERAKRRAAHPRP